MAVMGGDGCSDEQRVGLQLPAGKRDKASSRKREIERESDADAVPQNRAEAHLRQAGLQRPEAYEARPALRHADFVLAHRHRFVTSRIVLGFGRTVLLQPLETPSGCHGLPITANLARLLRHTTTTVRHYHHHNNSKTTNAKSLLAMPLFMCRRAQRRGQEAARARDL